MQEVVQGLHTKQQIRTALDVFTDERHDPFPG
jgi:hypothetical protein